MLNFLFKMTNAASTPPSPDATTPDQWYTPPQNDATLGSDGKIVLSTRRSARRSVQRSRRPTSVDDSSSIGYKPGNPINRPVLTKLSSQHPTRREASIDESRLEDAFSDALSTSVDLSNLRSNEYALHDAGASSDSKTNLNSLGYENKENVQTPGICRRFDTERRETGVAVTLADKKMPRDNTYNMNAANNNEPLTAGNTVRSGPPHQLTTVVRSILKRPRYTSTQLQEQTIMRGRAIAVEEARGRTRTGRTTTAGPTTILSGVARDAEDRGDSQGLPNIGNSCYVNAAVQCLRGLGLFAPNTPCKGEMAYCIPILQILFQVVHGVQVNQQTLHDLRAALFQHPCLARELDEKEGITITSQFDSYHVLEAVLDILCTTFSNGTPLSEMFGLTPIGVLTQLTCTKCQHCRYITETHVRDGKEKECIKVVSSPIHVVALKPDTGKTEPFMDLLRQDMNYVGDEASHCTSSTRCRADQKHIHQKLFHELGDKLIFHVNRGGFSVVNGMYVRQKNQQQILLTGTLLLDSVQTTDQRDLTTVAKQYFLRQVVLHIGQSDNRGHYVCVRYDFGNWFLFDDAKKPEFLGSTVNQLNEALRMRGLLGAVHLLSYSQDKQVKVAGCAPVSQKQLGWKIPRDGSGTCCLPDAVWNIMRQLEYNVSVEQVRQGIHPGDNNLGFRDIPTAEGFLNSQDPPLIFQRMDYCNQQSDILGLSEGNYLLEIRYWLESDHLGYRPPPQQIHCCAWLSDRGILVDNDPSTRPIQVDRKQIHCKEYRLKLFQKLWPVVTQVDILSTNFIGKGNQIPNNVALLRDRRLNKKRRRALKSRERQKRKQKRRKLASESADA